MDVETQKRIGTFLRRKREGLAPEDVDLVRPSRTRTPGLRREDVADMAGVSTVWYSKIERGQAEGVSYETLLALSRALRLKPPEHQYLMTLAQRPAVRLSGLGTEIGDDTRRLLDRLDPLPAIVMNDYLDILATNRSYRVMCGIDLDALPREERNDIGLMLSSPAWRRFLQAEDAGAREKKLARMIGVLRGISATRPDDREMKSRIHNFLDRSEEFSRLWKNEIVTQPEEIDFHFMHAVIGPIVLRKQIWLNTSGEATFRLNVYNPLDSLTDGSLSAVCPT